jgi:hypothetical protein
MESADHRVVRCVLFETQQPWNRLNEAEERSECEMLVEHIRVARCIQV